MRRPAAWLSAGLAFSSVVHGQSAAGAGGQGRLQNPALTESSGLAASRQRPGVLWTVNDSGHDPVVFAVGEHGQDLAMFRVVGVGRGDWEDLAVARLDGRHVLVIGDIGDNIHQRKQRALHLVPEPAVDSAKRAVRGELRVLRTIRFHYPDGAHDCEALAVEPDASHALLVAKTWWGGAPVYSLPLAASRTERVAERIGDVPVSWATGGALAPDGSRLLIGTYGGAYLYRRGVGEPWATALRRPPERIELPPRPQGEGVTFSADGQSIFASSEGAGTPLWVLKAE